MEDSPLKLNNVNFQIKASSARNGDNEASNGLVLTLKFVF
jgi:hypothetical protein